jgi:hypothetical protein
VSKKGFVAKKKGFREFLKSDGVRDLVEENAAAVAARASGNYKTEVIKAGTRYIATVEAADKKTRRENYKKNTLLKALG